MGKRFFLIGLACLISLNAVAAAARLAQKTIVLYDAASGDLPDPAMMGFTAFPPDGASLSFGDGSTVLDSTIAGTDTYAGLVASAATIDSFPILDSTVGFQVNFTLQVEAETHENNSRSGFSLILLDRNAKGIELAFWTNEIWAQSDDNTGGLFRHGEGVAFDTRTALIDYQIMMLADTYTLTADSQPILSGPMRDYSAFDRFPDPYETPNFLFLGDDTTSAQARVRLRFLSVTGTEPAAPTSAVTTTSTSLPEPTITSTPFPSVTPLASPTPSNPVGSLCPSGWLLAVAMIGQVMMIRKIKGTSERIQEFLRAEIHKMGL